MALSAKQFSLFLLLISLLSTHARDSQFFNKIPSTNNNNNEQEQQQQQPNFLPENENGYGLYGHESGQLPPSATTGEPTTTTPFTGAFDQPAHKYLPKNYNPVAYVTKPDDVNDSNTLAEEKSYSTNPNTNTNTNYYNGAQNYYNGQQEEYRSYPTTTNNNNNYYNHNVGMSDTRFRGGAAVSSRERYGGESNGFGFQPQGISDTRALENGKYFYDVSTEKYSNNHPYESLRGDNNRNYNGNSENNGYEFNSENSMGGYQNQEFEDEENNMP
ncbi:hypothetical protein DH2020_017470 [Rehmannia glutinosa]|uniref:Protein E6-like n=1 Tax=Rehmannia glutinosa TaxID=99300 RepID=A0ABR0WRU9_REHGL